LQYSDFDLMVLPVIIGVIALSTGAFGLSKGAEGASAMKKAEDRRKMAVDRYKSREKRLQSRADYVNNEAAGYGARQKNIKEDVFIRVANLIELIGKRANVDVYEILSGAHIQIPEIPSGSQHEIKAESVLKGFMIAAGASSLSSAATTGAVTAFATAGTGAAISGLSGAAANSAMLAALGGGSLAAGGGGMALGSLVLGGITVGPAIAAAGIAIALEGEKALTKAVELECEVNLAITEMTTKETLLDGIAERLFELSEILKRLKDEALNSLTQLEVLAEAALFDTDSDEHMEKLRALLLAVGSLAQIMRTPILGEDGSINPQIDIVISMESH
jgi:hypothetical protein